MRKFALFSILFLVILAFVACGEQKMSSDATMTDVIQHKLTSDTTLASAGIKVKTENGVVTLSGTVIGQEEAERAVRIAKSVANVSAVHSELKVNTNITNEDVKTRLSNQEDVDKQKEEQNNQRDAKTIAEDADITAKVKLTLAKDNLLSTYRIDVDTNTGVVTLTGTVKDEIEATQAVLLARSVENVKRVVSVLKLNS